MKTSITSNWGPLHRALCTFLLGIAALWAMPRSARAQLYVSQIGNGPNNGSVGEYNATTGAVINANFITGLPTFTSALALSGNNLFVMTYGSFMLDPNVGLLSPVGFTVSEYNATTGAAINATQTGSVTTVAGTATVTFTTQFSQIPIVTAAISVAPSPFIVATVVSQTTTGFVVNTLDTSTGLPANATVNWSAAGGIGSIITDFGPSGSPGFLALSGNDLFVSGQLGTKVAEYNATTGASINANLVTGLPPITSGLALSGNNLFVASLGTTGSVAEYNATTGTLINANFIPGLAPFATSGLVVSGNNLFVASAGGIGEYNATTGAPINANLIRSLTGVTAPLALSGNNLFVANTTTNGTVVSAGVGVYDATTGAAINANLITGLNALPTGLAVAPAPTPTPTCPVNVVVDPRGQYMYAHFTPPAIPNNANPTLFEYVNYCGFYSLNWQQKITTLPAGFDGHCAMPVVPNNPGPLIDSGNVVHLDTIVSPTDGYCTSSSSWNDCSLFAPPAFSDPPLGGYVGQSNPFPFYYPLLNFFAPWGTLCTIKNQNPCLFYQVSGDGKTFTFEDDPAIGYLPGDTASSFPTPGHFIAFQTSLVGVDFQNNPHTLFWWTWNSTYNGCAGGVSQTASVYPIDPGSGTGGVTVTSINGVQLPPLVLSSQIATTASGLAYSRVSQTFNGTVTLSNISSSAISGPLQILFMGMPANVTLVNATSNLSGTPYLTVPAVASLAPGQSVTVSVQFRNPSNAIINFTSVIYSGSILGAPTPPSVSCTATPNTLWPPNGKPVSVTVSGIITPGTSSLAPGGTTYAVIDEYGQDQPNGKINLGSGGRYLFQVWLIAARNGNDKDGRTYTILVNAQDALGNVGSCSSVVTVPHDQGH